MIEELVETLPMWVGVTLSPLPVLAVLIVLMTAKASTKAPCFLVGWMLGILAVGTTVLALPIVATHGTASTTAALVSVASGCLLLCLAVERGYRQLRAAGPTAPPRVFARLDACGPLPSATAGFVASAVNPKNAALVAAGAATLRVVLDDPARELRTLLAFTALASTSVALPIAVYFAARSASEAVFSRWRGWLTAHHGTLVVILLFVFGTMLLSFGLGSAFGRPEGAVRGMFLGHVGGSSLAPVAPTCIARRWDRTNSARVLHGRPRCCSRPPRGL